MYSSVPFGLAQCTVELPYVFIQCLLFGVISYWMISFEASAGKTRSILVVAMKSAVLKHCICLCPIHHIGPEAWMHIA